MTLTNLLPGTNYLCSITTVKSVFNNNYTSKIPSLIVEQTTPPSNILIDNFKLNEINYTISFNFQPPFGLYDNFTIHLLDLTTNITIYTKSYNFQLNSNHKFDLNYNNLLTSGKSYKLYSIVNRILNSHSKNLTHFTLRPNTISNLKIYALTKSRINVTWLAPVYSEAFLINTSISNDVLITTNETIQIDILNVTNLNLSVCVCSNKNCDLKSEFITGFFDFKIKKIQNLTQNIYDSNSLQLNFDMDPHDLNSFKFELVNLKKDSIRNCIYFINTQNENNNCSFLLIINCFDSKCGLKVDKLDYLTTYGLRIIPQAFSKTYDYESYYIEFRTKPTLPDLDYQTFTSYKIESKVESSQMLSVYLPKIDETNGNIIETCLYLVKLGQSQQFNQSLQFKIENLRDQEYLKFMFDSSGLCTNETSLIEPCLLKKYPNKDIFDNRLVLIGDLSDNIKVLNNETNNNTGLIDYENLIINFLEPSNIYQLFFIIKIGDNDTQLYMATSPTEPIQTKSNSANLSMSHSRDGIALWTIIVLCIISCVFLLGLIAVLVTLTLIKYKPSKFHKAAQLNQNQHGGYNATINLRSKYDDFLGNSDFVLPGEFSRNEMTNIWLVKHANGDLILDEEYRNLPDFRDYKTCNASQLLSNECKNRFLDIKAYDDSRVILDINSTTNNLSISTESMTDYYSETDYINANFVQGYSHDKKFIATQGPKKETINDFWRMIYQYRVSAIVMLTKLVEKGVERCTQYWPDKINIPEIYGDYEVTLKDQQKCGDYIRRTFDLTKFNNYNKNTTLTSLVNTPNSFSNRKILTVNQYYYPEWPDKDTPSTDPISILHLIRDVNRNHLTYQYPIVVHCSAGVGRTGTYITLDAMIEKINTDAKIDIFGFISKIRERRQYLVQTSKQYIFIHEALYEYCLYGFTDIDVAHLVSHYKNLKENKQNGKKTRLQNEFEKLCTAFYPNSQAREAFSNENKHRNRNLNCICYDENRIRLSSLNGSSYINATMIRGFELNNELIITQDPMQHTEFEFWKMITEYECNLIVALNKDLDNEFVYWPTDEQPIRNCESDGVKFVIQLVKNTANHNQDLNNLITKREFEIIEQKYSGKNKMNATHFVLNENWLEDKAPKNKSCILDLVGQVQKTAAKYDKSRIAVHAYGGGSNCSVFCALNILLYQFKNDQYVDVCRTVKKLKIQRPHMIETYEQYEFLYECLVEFVDMFGIYSQSSDSFNSRSSLNDSFNNLHCSSLSRTDPNQIKLNFS
ncbi:unnamed protein product [Brachionus calyciflorus]|uniref:Protein-tyrosine-phosphatase n=1 Tax=Brachionus calyciflorus TaxID=104777 RepID=A0A814HAN4_9BILA|nr:unnamed protein product [Brachionus calyciflorus]